MNGHAIFERLSSLADPARGRILHVLDGRELSVTELTAVLQLPQSTVSRHLRILGGEGWVTSRPEGTSRFYSLSGRLEGEAEDLWRVVRASLDGNPEVAQDAERAREVVAGRRTRSQEFFSSAAGRWDALRAELFGTAPEQRALLALLDPSWTVGDLGCGTGRLAETVAPFVGEVVGVDESSDMLAAARDRLADRSNVALHEGRLEALPVDDGALDVALLVLALHYVPEPPLALAEARRVLRPGGRLLMVDMRPHDREEYRERMGHLWLGFQRDQVEGWLEAAGFGTVRWYELPPDPEAKGPLLFAAVATTAS